MEEEWRTRVKQEFGRSKSKIKGIFILKSKHPLGLLHNCNCKTALKVTTCLLSSSNELACLSSVLRIADVREEDLLLKYNCLALNLHGVRSHTLRLKRRKPSKKCF